MIENPLLRILDAQLLSAVSPKLPCKHVELEKADRNKKPAVVTTGYNMVLL